MIWYLEIVFLIEWFQKLGYEISLQAKLSVGQALKLDLDLKSWKSYSNDLVCFETSPKKVLFQDLGGGLQTVQMIPLLPVREKKWKFLPEIAFFLLKESQWDYVFYVMKNIPNELLFHCIL